MNQFLSSLHLIFSSPEYTNTNNPICRWNTDNSIEILDKDRFENEILPVYFKTKNFKSFVRQLNNYYFFKLKNKLSWSNINFNKLCYLDIEKINRRNQYNKTTLQDEFNKYHFYKTDCSLWSIKDEELILDLVLI